MGYRLLGLGVAIAAALAPFAACGGSDSGNNGGGGSNTTMTTSASGGSNAGGDTSTSEPSGGGGGTTSDGGSGGSAPSGKPFAYVGCSDGKIRVFDIDVGTGALSPVDETDAGATPSFLAFTEDHRFVYAVDEGQSMLRAFSIDKATGKLALLNAVSSNGNDPAHIAVDKAGKFVFGVNYGAGSVTTIHVQNDGSLGAPVGTMMTGMEAHEIVFDASQKFAFVPNKGSDYVAQFDYDAATGALSANQVPHVTFKQGAGPRHLAFHPNGNFAYVIDELDSKIVAFSFDKTKGQLTKIQMPISTVPDDFKGANTGAEVAFGKSGKFLYGSNRGHNSIVRFSVDAGTGQMTRMDWTMTSGMTPRHFSIEPSGAVMLVANQDSGSVVTFGIDPNSGALTQLMSTNIVGPEYAGVVYLSP